MSTRSLLFFAVVALSLVPAAFSQPQNPKQQAQAQKYVEKGQLLYEQGKLKPSLEAYKKANELSPDSPGPYREIARCYRDLKQHEMAFHYLSEYLSRKPTADERDGILQYMTEQRPQLSTKNKALLTINSEPQGAVVFVIDKQGEAVGVGVTPIKDHPIPTDAVMVRLSGTTFEILEEKIDAAQTPLEVTITLDPLKRLQPSEPLKPTETTTPKKKTRAFIYFGAGAASVVGSLLVGAQFNKSVEVLAQTSSDDPEVDRRYNVVVIEAVSADVLGALAIGAGVLGVLQLRKIGKEKTTSTLQLTPKGLALSGSF